MRRLGRLLCDALLIMLATAVAIMLRSDLHIYSSDFAAASAYLWATLAVGVLMVGVSGLDLGFWRYASVEDAVRIMLVAAATAIGAMAIAFAANRLSGVARSVPILQFVLIATFLLVPRLVARARHRVRRRVRPFTAVAGAERSEEQILLVGTGALAEAFMRSLTEVGVRTVRVVGIVSPSARHAGRMVQHARVLGTVTGIDDVVQTLSVHGIVVDRIVVALPQHEITPDIRSRLARLRDGRGVEIDYLAERLLWGSRSEPGSGFAPAMNAAVQEDRSEPGEGTGFSVSRTDLDRLARRPYWRVKRVIDAVLAALMLVILLPLIAAVTLLVVVDVGWPAVFWQERPGLGGRFFRLFKLRTMAAAHDAHGRRIPDDERVSLVGHVLRRTRLDELPQLWNVMIGDMSFIGPRPLLPVDQSNSHAARLLVRPGLTGWAQVQGGREIGAADKAALDLWYIQSVSIRLDLRILYDTIVMVLFGERISSTAIERAWTELERAGMLTSPPRRPRAAE